MFELPAEGLPKESMYQPIQGAHLQDRSFERAFTLSGQHVSVSRDLIFQHYY